MLNQIVLVGRLTHDIEIIKNEDGKKYANLKIAVPRSFKNSEGVYETDFFDCIAFESIAENTASYCQKGDIIGIKGRMQSKLKETKSGEKFNMINVVTEKVTFLSSRSNEKSKSNQEQER